MNNVQFRNMTENDLEECAQVFLEIFGPNGCGDPWNAETSLKAVQESTEHLEYCFVATVDEKIIGFVLSEPVARDADINVYIEWIGVLSAYQGQHIGSTLFEKVISVAKKHGNQNVSLFGDLKHLSFDWYKKMGLKETGWVELMKAI